MNDRKQKTKTNNKSNKKRIFDVLFYVFSGVFIFTMLFVVENNIVEGLSMNDTLDEGQRVINLRNNEDVSHGDIVITKPEAMNGQRVVKRLIAMSGDTITFENNEVYLNGEKLEEDYVKDGYVEALDGSFTVPEDHVWVMGDNRNNSIDSRHIGFVSMDEVEGRVIMSLFPFGSIE